MPGLIHGFNGVLRLQGFRTLENLLIPLVNAPTRTSQATFASVIDWKSTRFLCK